MEELISDNLSLMEENLKIINKQDIQIDNIKKNTYNIESNSKKSNYIIRTINSIFNVKWFNETHSDKMKIKNKNKNKNKNCNIKNLGSLSEMALIMNNKLDNQNEDLDNLIDKTEINCNIIKNNINQINSYI